MPNPPKPLELRLAEQKGTGQTVSHQKIDESKLVLVPTNKPDRYDPDFLPMPEGLLDRGVKEWHQIWDAGWPWLHPREDYHWIEQICRAYDDLEAFRRRIKRDGLMVKGYAGQVVANPLIKESRACEAAIRTCLSQIGFSPVARAHLGIAELKAQSTLADLQDRARKNGEQ